MKQNNRDQEKWNTPLLERFLKDRIKSFVEPTRFSLKKYRASLFTGLTNYKQDWIAKKSGVGHSLLRKWRTEEAFKRVEQKHIEDFTLFFIDHLSDLLKKMETFIIVGPSLLDRIMSDFDGYSPELQENIIKVLTSKENLGLDPIFHLFGNAMRTRASILKARTDSKQERDLNRKFDEDLRQWWFDILGHLLMMNSLDLQSKISTSRRNDIARNLLHISTFLKDLIEWKNIQPRKK